MIGASARAFNTWDRLKLIALVFMFIDHIGAYFFVHDVWIRSIGRSSAPVFLFLAGYASSYRFSKKLLILACAMQLSNMLMGHADQAVNILFNIILCRAALHRMEKRGRVIERPFEWFIVLGIFVVFSSFFIQYGTLGMMFAVCGYMKRYPERYSRKVLQRFLAASLVVCAFNFLLFFDFSTFEFLLMLPFLALDYWLIMGVELRELDTSKLPAWLLHLLMFSSHYSGEIYAYHLIAISWLTGFPL